MLQSPTNRGFVTGLLWVLLITCEVPANAQVGTEPNAAREESEQRLLPSHLVRFEVVLGRLQLSPEYFRIGSAHDQTVIEDGRTRMRSISVSVMRGKPTLQFQDHGGDETWSVFFKPDNVVEIVNSVKEDRGLRTLTYHQSSRQLTHQSTARSVTASVEYSDGRAKREVHARSLWHVAAAEPEFFDAHLRPLLERLEPSWDVDRLVAEVRNPKNKSLHQSESSQVEQLVSQLDSPVATVRTAAALELERLGLAAESDLSDRLASDLSSQQNLTIRKLISGMQPVGNDTPKRLAVWFAGASRNR